MGNICYHRGPRYREFALSHRKVLVSGTKAFKTNRYDQEKATVKILQTLNQERVRAELHLFHKNNNKERLHHETV